MASKGPRLTRGLPMKRRLALHRVATPRNCRVTRSIGFALRSAVRVRGIRVGSTEAPRAPNMPRAKSSR